MPYAEDKRIKAGIAADPDTYELSRREIKQMRPFVFKRAKYKPMASPGGGRAWPVRNRAVLNSS